MIRKLLAGAASLAIVASGLVIASAGAVVGSSVAGATTPPPTNINCVVSGSVAFNKPGLSQGGALTSNATVKTKASLTGEGAGCSPKPISVTIPSATTPCPQTAGVPDPGDPAACLASKTKDGVTTYAIAQKPNYYDTSGSYATSGLADLTAALQAKPLKVTVDLIPVQLVYGSATEVLPGGACGATDAGFNVSGNAAIKAGTIGTYTVLACIDSDTGPGTTGNFVNDLLSSTAVIQTAVIGGASSLTVTLPNADCTVSGSVAFNKPGLSAGGALTSNATVKTKATTQPAGTNCSTTPISVTIPSATTPCPQTAGVPDPGDPAACLASKTKDGVTTYAIAKKPNYYDTTGSFATSGLADLQAALQAKPLKTTVGLIPIQLAYGSATEVLPGGVCGATDVGFNVSGNATVKAGTVGTYVDLVCLSGDTGPGTTGNFLNDLQSSTAVIQTAVVGGNSSLVVTLGLGPS